jgi:hypothetical protein
MMGSFSSPPLSERLWEAPNLLSNGYRGALRPRVNRLEHWSYISIPQYFCMSCYLVKHRDNCTFYSTMQDLYFCFHFMSTTDNKFFRAIASEHT